MKRCVIICISIMTIVILIITTSMVSFAGVEASTVKLNRDMSNEAIVNIAKEHGNLNSNGVIVEKLSEGEKRDFVTLSNVEDFDKVDVYTIERELESGAFEKTVFAEVDIAGIENNNRSTGENVVNKDGRVSVQAIIGYKTRAFGSLTHYAGYYYGGKVLSQQSGTTVTSLSATYHEAGVYYDENGYASATNNYVDAAVFSVENHTSRQIRYVSTGRYYNLDVAVSMIGTKYKANYTVGGNSYSITVNAYV